MKCAKHTAADAVGVCVSCGIGVCRSCEIKVVGRTHCKTCVEAGRAYDPQAAPVRTYPTYGPTISPPVEAKPTGNPSRAFFIMGFIGMIILMASGMINWIFDTTGFFFYWMFMMPFPVYTISLAIFCASIVVTSIALYGYRRNYGSLMGIATFIISLILPWFLLIAKLLLYTGLVFTPHTSYYPPYYTYYYPGPLYIHYFALYITGAVLIGVLFILWGCALFVVRKHTGKAGLPIAAGILFIIAGSFWCTIMLYQIGSILLIPAGILWMISLATSRMPGDFTY